MTAAKRGRFITLEGGEGAGKSTHVRRLADRLREIGVDVVETREPGGTPPAEEIRRLLVTGAIGRWEPMTEALLHYAARREHLTRTVWPAMEQGRWVVSDRHADSTMAYQGYALGLGRERIEALHRIVVGNFAPDLTIVLDLPAERGLVRARDRGTSGSAAGEDRYERMGLGFHERLRQAFLEIAAREASRCVVIDATAAVDVVANTVWSEVLRRLEPAP